MVRKSPIDHPVQPPAGRPAVYLKSVVDRPGVRARGTSTTARRGTLLRTAATYQSQLYIYVAVYLNVLRGVGRDIDIDLSRIALRIALVKVL